MRKATETSLRCTHTHTHVTNIHLCRGCHLHKHRGCHFLSYSFWALLFNNRHRAVDNQCSDLSTRLPYERLSGVWGSGFVWSLKQSPPFVRWPGLNYCLSGQLNLSPMDEERSSFHVRETQLPACRYLLHGEEPDYHLYERLCIFVIYGSPPVVREILFTCGIEESCFP